MSAINAISDIARMQQHNDTMSMSRKSNITFLFFLLC